MSALTVQQVLTGTELGTSAGLTDTLHATIGGRDVLYALNRAEGDVYEFSVASDGTLSLASTLLLSGGFSVGSEPALSLSTGADGPALMVAGLDPAAGSFITLGPTGGLGSQTADLTTGELAGPVGFPLGGDDALLNGSDTGVDLYVDGGTGLQFSGSLSDTPSVYLADTRGGTAHIGGSSPYLAVASTQENGLTVLRVDLAGTMSVASSFGAAEGLPVSTPSDLLSVTRDGVAHLVLASSGSSSLTTLRVDDDGSLWLTDHVLDSTSTRFQSVTAMDATNVGDATFLAAAGSDGGISLFTMLPNGRLVHLASLTDTAETTLYRASSLSMSAAQNTLQVAVTSQWEAGLTVLAYDISSLGQVHVLEEGDSPLGTAGDDQIIGSDVADTLQGGDGEDILYDGAESDVLIGGSGADLFVFAADGVADRIEDFELGVDRLDLSAFDFLYDVSQLDVVPTSDGAILTFRDEEIEIASSDSTPLSAASFSNADILNVDRPPVLPINQDLSGGPMADHLVGGAGDDTIAGASGNDVLSGVDGADLILGQDGNDTLDGGAGTDTLQGGPGADNIAGGVGDDVIDGGPGGDLLYGDDFEWVDPV